VNFTGGIQAVDNGTTSTTDVSLATTVPNDHTFTGNLSSSGSANFNFSGSSGTFDTTTGNVSLNGNTTVASGKTVTAGAGTTTGTAVSVNTGNGLSSGTALSVDTGTSAFSGNAVNITSAGNFTGTLVNLSANTTTAGTLLGLSATSLTTGSVINASLGSAVYTGAGALRLTANAASTGTLLAISGTTLAANGGKAADITLGTPGGAAEPGEGKAIRVALGAVGDAYYANAASGYAGSFARFQVAGADVLKIDGTSISTSDSFSQTGAATFSTGTGNISLNGNIVTNITQTGATSLSTGTGPVSLNGDTTVATGKGLLAASGAGKLDFSAATGTFDTSTGAVTLRGNTATASGVTFTAGAGITGGTNAVSVATGALTTGSAVAVNVGASAPDATTSAPQGLGLDITGSGAFQGLANNANLVRISSTGAFTGTLTRLAGNTTLSGTILGISATSLTLGKAIDVQLAATYAGTSANTGAVNIGAGPFSGNILAVVSGGDASTATTNLAKFQANATQGHIVDIAVTGAQYNGTGALFVDLTGTTGTPTGTSIRVDTSAGYTGRFIDLALAGSSKFSVDPTNVTTALNIVQTGATTFSTGTGNISLNGNIVTNVSQTGATTFSTGTGAVSLNGAVTLAAGKSLTSAGGVANFDFSASTGTFQTGSGAVTLNGNTTVANGKTLAIGGNGANAGTAITAHFSTTASLDFPSLGAGSCSSLTVTVSGAVAGDTASATPTPVTGGIETVRMTWMAYVSAADTVTVRACSIAGTNNAAAQTYRIDVWRH
jgi:hypothetical protein